jgi:hypothetical protein
MLNRWSLLQNVDWSQGTFGMCIDSKVFENRSQRWTRNAPEDGMYYVSGSWYDNNWSLRTYRVELNSGTNTEKLVPEEPIYVIGWIVTPATNQDWQIETAYAWYIFMREGWQLIWKGRWYESTATHFKIFKCV